MKTEITITICKTLRKLCNFYTRAHKHGVSIQMCLKKIPKTTTLDLLKALIILISVLSVST